MNLLFVAECDWFDSVVFDLHFMAEGLASRGHKVYAIDHRWPSQSMRVYPVYQQIDVPEISVFGYDGKLHVRRPGFINGPPVLLMLSLFVSHGYALAKAIKEWDIDAVIIYSSIVNGWQSVIWGKLFNIPSIFRIIDKHHILAERRFIRIMTKSVEKFIYRFTDHIMALTPDYARYTMNMGAKKSKVELLLFPVDTTLFQPCRKDSALLEKLGIKETDRVLVFMGTLFYFTGVDRLVNALSQILKEVPDVKLVIVGDGPARKKVEDNSKKMGIQDRVIITGYQPFRMMPDYINLADVCVNAFPINDKTKEIMSSKIYQYFACGKPVVSTALPGITSLIPEECGIIYAYSCDEMAEKIIKLLKDEKLCLQMGEAGLEYTKAVNDYESIITQFEEVIQAQVEKKAGKKKGSGAK